MDRTVQPACKKTLEFSLPSPEKVTSVGVNEIWYVPSTLSDALKIEIIFNAGKYFERIPGEAQFTLQLLDKGVANKTAGDIANELDYYGSHLDLKMGQDFSSLTFYALRKKTTKLLPLLYSIVQRPTFPEKELDILKKITKENLRVNLEKNEFVASNSIREKIYEQHPYGKSLQLIDIDLISLEAIREYFKHRFRPYKIFITGNVEPDTIESINQNIDLSETPTEFEEYPLTKTANDDFLIDGPSKMQASIRLGKRTISRAHAEWPGLQLANHVLGGYFGSRLMKNIREEKGLTYGIHSSIQSMLHSSWIGISAEVNSSNTDLVLAEIKKELTKLNDLESDELEMAKNHFIGSLQNDITTIFAVSDRIKTLILNSLPDNFYQDLIEKVDSVDRHAFAEITRSHFDPGSFTSVVVK